MNLFRLSIIITLLPTIFQCNSNQLPNKKDSKDSVIVLDLNKYKSVKFTGELLRHKPNYQIGFIDTVYSSHDLLILIENTRKSNVAEDETEPTITYKKITIVSHGQKVFEKDSVVNFGEIEYNSVHNIFSIPMVFDVDPESFDFLGTMYIYRSDTNTCDILKSELYNFTNAPFYNDTSFYFISNNILYACNQNSTEEVVHLSKPEYRIFKLSVEKNSLNIIFSKNFPDDVETLQTNVPFNDILKN